MSFHWYKLTMLTLLPAAGGGVSDVVATDSFTVTESAVVEVFPVATESATVTEVGTGLALVVAVDSGTITESAVTTFANDAAGSDSAVVTESVTALLATVTAVDTGTLSEAATGTVDVTGSESGTVSESALGFVAVVASDSFTVTELASATQDSGTDFSQSDAVTFSESAVSVVLTVTATESLTVTESGLGFADAVASDSGIVSESASTAADLTGEAEYDTISIGPRITVNESAGRISLAFDSSYITFDSTLVTWDGSYVGDIPNIVGVRVRQPVDSAEMDAKLAGVV